MRAEVQTVGERKRKKENEKDERMCERKEGRNAKRRNERKKGEERKQGERKVREV